MYFLVLPNENNLSYNEQAFAFTLSIDLPNEEGPGSSVCLYMMKPRKKNNAQLLLPYNSE